MAAPPRVLYLHGFASSAQSSKASYFRTRFAEHGVALETPDFNLPDFSTLTISRMLRQVADSIAARDEGPVVLMGSSLGGFVAVQSAVDNPSSVSRLVLLAPALDFSAERVGDLGDRSLEQWRATDRLDVFHYAYGRVIPVHYALFDDAQQYRPLEARVNVPVQVFQGSRDAAVDPATVERWTKTQPHAELHLLDDDHQMLASLEAIWVETARFLGLAGSLTPAPSRSPDGEPRA
jgi:pimeloyl-ACP methyl ester carboxylesterase